MAKVLCPPPATWAPAADPLEREAAMAYLVEVSTRDLLAGVTTNARVYAGRAATMILTAASDRHADLIVLTSGGRRGITRWMLGNVAEEVAREANIPVLVLRAGSQRGDDVEHRDPGLVQRVGEHLRVAG